MELVKNSVDILVKDSTFNKKLDEYLDKILEDGKINSMDIPDLLLLCMECYENMNKFKLSYEDLGEFINQVMIYIFNHKEIVPEEQKEKMFGMVNTLVKLILMKPKVKNCLSKYLCK